MTTFLNSRNFATTSIIEKLESVGIDPMLIVCIVAIAITISYKKHFANWENVSFPDKMSAVLAVICTIVLIVVTITMKCSLD